MLERIPINYDLKDKILTFIKTKDPGPEASEEPKNPGSTPGHEAKSRSGGSHGVDLGPLLVDKYLTHYGIKFHTKRTTKGDATMYCLDQCVFDPSHAGNDSAIIQDDSGLLRYQCFHNSC